VRPRPTSATTRNACAQVRRLDGPRLVEDHAWALAATRTTGGGADTPRLPAARSRFGRADHRTGLARFADSASSAVTPSSASVRGTWPRPVLLRGVPPRDVIDRGRYAGSSLAGASRTRLPIPPSGRPAPRAVVHQVHRRGSDGASTDWRQALHQGPKNATWCRFAPPRMHIHHAVPARYRILHGESRFQDRSNLPPACPFKHPHANASMTHGHKNAANKGTWTYTTIFDKQPQS